MLIRHEHNSDDTTWALPAGAVARLGRGSMGNMDFSPCGKYLAVTTRIGFWWYDLDTMQPVALWDTERGMVSAISFSPNGQWIATSKWGGIIKVWETETQQCTTQIQGWHKGISRLAFSPNGKYLAASGNSYGNVSVWLTKTGRHVATFTVAEPKRSPRASRYPICFSPDGTQLAYVSAQFVISVRHPETEEQTARILTNQRLVNALTFSPCGQFLAAGIEKNDTRQKPEIHVWNLQQETLEEKATCEGNSVTPFYSTEGLLRVAEVCENEVKIWDSLQRERCDTFEHQAGLESLRFSNNDTFIALAGRRNFHVWRRGTPPTVVSLPGHTTPNAFVCFSREGSTLVSRYMNESGIVFWDVAQKRAIRMFSAPTANTGSQCALSPCEKMLAINTGKMGQTIEILNVLSGTRIKAITEHQQSVSALAFSPDGKTLASGDLDGQLYLWNVKHWEKRHTIIGYTRRIKTIAFHPDSKRFVVSSSGKVLKVWDVASGKQVGSLSLKMLSEPTLYKGNVREIQRLLRSKPPARWSRDILSIAYSPCGNIIAGGLLGEIRFWDARTYEIHMAIILPLECQRAHALAFSPCGQYLAVGAWWGGTKKVSIRLWDVATGENIATFWGHPTDVQDLAFSPDGSLLASGSFDGTILLWDMKSVIGS